MTTRGEVAYKVKRAILVVRQFTVNQLVTLTHLDRPSVETVVQRLLQEGGIVPLETEGLPGGRGRPRQVYGVSADPAQQQKLRESITAFAPMAEATPTEPSSTYYLEVQAWLAQVESGAVELTPEALTEARAWLALARRTEALLEEGGEVATAYLDFAEARLAFAQGDLVMGERYSAQALAVFVAYHLPEAARGVEEHRLAQHLRQQLLAPEKVDLEKWAEALGQLTQATPLRAALAQLAQKVNAAQQAQAALKHANQELHQQMAQLKAHNARLALHQQSVDSLLQMLAPRPTPTPPRYPGEVQPPTMLQEKQSDLLPREVLAQLAKGELWAEADKRAQARGKRPYFH